MRVDLFTPLETFQADMDVDTPFGVVPLQVDQLAEIGIER